MLMRSFAVLGACTLVLLAVARSGVDELGRLVGRGGDGLGGPSWVLFHRSRAPMGAVSAALPVDGQMQFRRCRVGTVRTG